VREIAPGDIEPDRVGTRGEQERAISQPASIRHLQLPALDVDRDHARTKSHIDFKVVVEFGRSEEIGLLRRCPREIAFRQVKPIAGHRGFGAQHRYPAGVTLLTKRFRRLVTGRAATDDHDGVRLADRYRTGAPRRADQLLPNVCDTGPPFACCELARRIEDNFDAPT